jgi:hypothetical protein
MKTPEDDSFLGRAVLERKLVTRDALLECLFQMAQERRAGNPRPLGVLLVSRGLLTQEDLDGLLSDRVSGEPATPLSESEVGKLLVASGLITRENIEECLRLQEELRKSGKTSPPLGELVVHRGYVTERQVARVLAYQKKAVFACAGCGVRVSAQPPPPGSRYRCRKCGGALALVETPASGSAGDTRMALQEGERGEETQVEIDRAVGAYLKQKNLVRRDQLRETQRLQAEFARYGLVVPLLELLRRSGAISLPQKQEIESMDFGKMVREPDWKVQSIPGYRLTGRVASGGFAAIWTAEPAFGQGRVAVKMLHPERAKDPRSVARFEWEAMLLKRFNHAGIVRGLDHGFERGHHFLIMEYVEGRSLGQVLSETGSMPLRDVFQISRQVASALDYLHEQGYLHRDVKPDNVLLDDEGKVKLCDLGFAVPVPKVPSAGTRVPTAVGTVGYMSPEVASGKAELTVGADIYSLGILLYALLTGHEPFAGASSEEVVTDQLQSGMPVPNLMMVNAPPSVIQLLKRMMHPDPKRRFASLGEVIVSIDKLGVA